MKKVSQGRARVRRRTKWNLYSGRLPFQDLQIPRMACISFDLNAAPPPSLHGHLQLSGPQAAIAPLDLVDLRVHQSLSPKLSSVVALVKSLSGKLCNRCRRIHAVVCRAYIPSLIRDHVPVATQAERAQLYRKQISLQGSRSNIPLSCPTFSITRSTPSYFRIRPWSPLDARNEEGLTDALHGLITTFIHTRIFKEQHWTHDGISTEKLSLLVAGLRDARRCR